MKTRDLRTGSKNLIRCLFTIMCAMLIVPASGLMFDQNSVPAVPAAQQTVRIPPEQLDSLVAPIALYPDSLLSQTLVASTYPLEIMQLQQWLDRNKGLKDKVLADAVSKQPWDPSIQAMAAMPDVVKRLADDIQWTTDLGNAFLAQQSDVMDAIQRMRQKAQGTGALQSNQYQKVETQPLDETGTVIVIEQADPEVVYVPSYNPLYVFGEPFYPYPDIWYPYSYFPYYPYYPYYPGMAASAIYYGFGWAMGAAWRGGWGWRPVWGHNDIYINHHNYFNRFGYRGGYRGFDNTWRHNPHHRGGAPYRDRATADRYGGTMRGDSLGNRQEGARRQLGRQGGNLPSTRNRGGAGGFSDRTRPGGVTDRSRPGGVTDRSRPGGFTDRSRPGGVTDRSRPGGVTDRSRPGGMTDRSRPGGVTDRSRPGGVTDRSRPSGGSDRIGGRDIGRGSGGSRTAFGSGARGFSGSSARSSSGRGASSVGGSRGGASSRAGGGGSHRSGGGGRRR